MAQVELTVPDLGGFNDIPVIEVLVAPGETVAKDAPLVTLESDKATMEVPASEGGVVRELRVKIGDKVSQGTVLATIDAAESKPAPTPPPARAAVESAEKIVDLIVPDIGDFTDIAVIEVLVAPGDKVAKESALVTLESDKATMEVPASTGGVLRDVRVNVGDKVSKGSVIATVATTDVGAAAPVAAVRQAQPERTTRQGDSKTNGAADVAVSPSKSANGTASSALGVDMSRVHGSGPNGRVTRDDVQGFVKSAIATPATTGGGVHAGTTSGLGLNLPPWPSVDFAKFGPVERVALTRIQKISGPVLARNWVMIPHVTQNDEADVTDLEAFRKQINGERKDVKVTMLAFLMKAAVTALKRFPQFNASLDGDELVLKKYYHLGFAADTPNGLLVPVIRDVDKKGVIDIARETSELAGKARDGKLGPANMSGATFTISSLGSIGGTTFTPIINAPEVAILGACKADIRPVWDGTAFVPRLMQPLSLSYDHRVIDGASAARFTVEIKHALTDLRRTLL